MRLSRRIASPGVAWKAYAAAAALLCFVYFSLAGETEAQLAIYVALVVAAPITILAGIRRYRPRHPGNWLLFAAGLSLWFCGDAYWAGHEWILGTQAPYPSPADVAYLGGYPLLIAGVVVTVRGWGRPRLADLLDAGIVAVPVGLALTLFLLEPLLAGAQTGVFGTVLAVGTPTADFLMFLALLPMVFRGSHTFALRVVLAGMAALIVADVAYSYLNLTSAYASGMFIDAGWIASYALWGVAALHPSMASVRALPRDSSSTVSPARIATLLAALLAAPLLLVVQASRGEVLDAFDIGLAGIATTLLVGMRLLLLHRAQMSALSALAQSEERFRLAQGVSGVGTWDIDLVTGELTWSEVLGTLIAGSRTAPASFEAWREFVHPDDRERVTANLARGLEQSTDFEHEYRFRRHGGREGWMYSRGRVFNDESGTPIRALGVAVDVTSRHLVEGELKKSEERFRLAETAAGIGSWDMNLSTGVLSWSDSLRRLMGVAPGALATYEGFIDWVHPDDRNRVDREISAALKRATEFQIQYRFRRADAVEGWMELRGRTIVDDFGTPVRSVGVAVDITDRRLAQEHRRKLEQQLRQAHKLEAVGRLAGGVAHDFNNILLAIRGNGELALDAFRHGEPAAEEVQEMVEAAERAASLTGQLLAFSRRQVLRPEPLNLNEVIAEMDKLLGRMIGEDVELRPILDESPVRVNADRGQLEQVIANLAVNARDAMGEGGRLTLEVTTTEIAADQQVDLAPGQYAMLAVSDTGCGMDDETLAKIFEPFFTTKAEGTGFGLATVHGIVRQSGGSIWVYSEVGVGTTFKIFLPLLDDDPALVPDAPRVRASLPRSAGERILLVEDDAHVRRIVRNLLLRAGYEVLVASGAEEALEVASAVDETIDLLLTDIVMPGMNGRELAEKIRAFRPTVATLFMSGYTDDVVVRRGVLEAGMAFIQKPFGADDLGRRVRDVLDGRPDGMEAA